MKTDQRKGYTILEVIIALAVLAILMSMLLPVLAQARNRATRLKCQNNIKQVAITFIAFASENEVKFPWLIVDVDKEAMGIAGGKSYRTDVLYGMDTIRTMLGTSRTLLSPCDPDRGDVNDQVDLTSIKEFPDNAASYGIACGSGVDTKYSGEGYAASGFVTLVDGTGKDERWKWATRPFPPETKGVKKGDVIVSNGLGSGEAPRHATKDTTDPDLGADFIRGTTMLVVTRNIQGPINSGDSLSNQSLGNPDAEMKDYTEYAKWLGSENHSDNERTMAGLTGNQGQIGLADGSAHMTSDNMLKEWVRAHHGDDYGIYAGIPSPIIDTPNEPDPYPLKEGREDVFGWRWDPDLGSWVRTDGW